MLLSLNSLFSSSLFFFSMPKPSPLLFSTYPRGLPQAKWTPRRSPKKTAVQGRRRRTEEEGRGTRASELAPPPSTPKCIDGELSTLELNSLNLTTQTLSCEEETAAPCAARKSQQLLDDSPPLSLVLHLSPPPARRRPQARERSVQRCGPMSARGRGGRRPRAGCGRGDAGKSKKEIGRAHV